MDSSSEVVSQNFRELEPDCELVASTGRTPARSLSLVTTGQTYRKLEEVGPWPRLDGPSVPWSRAPAKQAGMACQLKDVQRR
jgi:hypothetical protein